MWLGFPSPSLDMDALEYIKKWTYNVVCSSVGGIRRLYPLLGWWFLQNLEECNTSETVSFLSGLVEAG